VEDTAPAPPQTQSLSHDSSMSEKRNANNRSRLKQQYFSDSIRQPWVDMEELNEKSNYPEIEVPPYKLHPDDMKPEGI